MEEILKQNKSKSSHKEFEKLLAEDLNNRVLKEGSILSGLITRISKKHVFVDISAKSEGAIPIEEFKITREINDIKIGSRIDVFLERIENRAGEVVISREKAARKKSWNRMKVLYKEGKPCTGIIKSRIRGGMIVDSDGCLMFLPSSQITLRPLKDYSKMMNVPLKFLIVKMDERRGNVVCSHRQILEKERDKGKDKILSTLKEGQVVDGVVKNLVEWGAFIDIAGVDALLHITDCSWQRINKPSDLLTIGQNIKVLISKIDPDSKKISCSLKLLSEDPYIKLIDKYKINTKYKGVITKIVPYGAFCSLDENIEGLIHTSQLSWKKNIDPKKAVSVSESVEVELIEIDKEKRRMSLSRKSCLTNPWITFTKSTKIGDIVSGVIKNRTTYGLFISINNTELDCLVHFKDLSFNENESELEKYRKGQSVRVKILEINEEEEKIRAGIKQISGSDPFDFFMKKNLEDIVTAVVHSSSQNGIYVHFGKKNFTILIKKNQLAKEPENQRQARFVRGDKLDVMITALDKKNRKIQLSIKSLEEKIERENIKKYGSKSSGGILRDILGAALKKKPKSKK